MPMLRRSGGRWVTSSPPRVMVPEVGATKPAIMRSVVDLPHPDGPKSEKNSPSRTWRSMPDTAAAPPG